MALRTPATPILKAASSRPTERFTASLFRHSKAAVPEHICDFVTSYTGLDRQLTLRLA